MSVLVGLFCSLIGLFILVYRSLLTRGDDTVAYVIHGESTQ
jgi:hypothetical protein